jgi:hypothetical protein
MYKLTGRVNKYLARQHRLSGRAHWGCSFEASHHGTSRSGKSNVNPGAAGPSKIPHFPEERIEPPFPKDQGAKLHSEKARLPTPI